MCLSGGQMREVTNFFREFSYDILNTFFLWLVTFYLTSNEIETENIERSRNVKYYPMFLVDVTYLVIFRRPKTTKSH